MSVFRQELTPNSFIERAGEVFPTRIAVSDADVEFSWAEFRLRALRFASALRQAGVQKGDRVAFLAVNSEPLLLAHFAVPLAGGVLVAINTRLHPNEVGYVVEHAGAQLVFYSTELERGVEALPATIRRFDLGRDLATFLAGGSETPLVPVLTDEYESIAIDYTSGTTGRPKGVVYHHRGAYLNALAMALEQRLDADSVFLWTLPMFHCNGWTFTWAVAAVGAKSVCVPKVDPSAIWPLLDRGVTHLCAAPTVLLMLMNDPLAHTLPHPVRVFTAGAPPSPTLLAQLAELNFQVDHVYGLTETYGPFTIHVASPEYQTQSDADRATSLARQGVPHVLAGEVRVVDAELRDVPRDGATMGEVVMRGNTIMKGYFNDEAATARAFEGDWFHSGDVAVMHEDGFIELKDRSKDVIISGGENISTIEVEQTIASHPAVFECAVVSIPDEQWGEVAKAFVTLKSGQSASAEEIIAHCRARIAAFKAPKQIAFGDLPKTSTGKIKKFLLREREWAGRAKRIH